MHRRLHRPLLTLVLALAVGACVIAYRSMGPAASEPILASEALIAADGARLPLRRFLPPTRPLAVVIALHGMNDYSNAFTETGAYLAAHGIATYAYDQRGFGAGAGPGYWPGVPSLIGDLQGAVRAVRAAHPEAPVHVLGESMGGAVAMVAATSAE
ncbi:MAG: alpha/beta fold hydrolase, partial [Alphaproteobacteria bacterium]|nr:alpha/beta fold hydrolase [Alphaproteobacteria bacterium]